MEEKEEIVRNMIAENTPLDYIVKVTSLSIEEIKALQAKSTDITH
jgi:hypothetical protein